MDRRRSGGPFQCVVGCSCSGRVTRGLQERPHLAARGLQHNVKQCKDKLKALNKKYKEVINRHRQSGAGVESDEEVTQRDFCFSCRHIAYWEAERSPILHIFWKSVRNLKAQPAVSQPPHLCSQLFEATQQQQAKQP